MLIYEKSIVDITLDDIRSLVEDEIDENNFIEYKSELNKNGRWDTNSLIFKFFLLIFHLILYTMKYNLLL